MFGNFNIRKIQSDVQKIIEYSQGYPEGIVNVSNLLDRWNYDKKSFMALFNGDLIVPCGHIQARVNKKHKDKFFSEFIFQARNRGYLGMSRDGESIGVFIQNNKDGFFDNTVVFPNKKLDIKQGAKLLKSFKKFGDNESVRHLQDLASSYIQKDKLEGYVYISIDPRDYLTISDNVHNWRSCHALDSDYRAGNLSYMVDDVTLVAYMTECENDMRKLKCTPEGVEWNSKIWRMLVHVNPDNGIYYGRQYPFYSDDVLRVVDNKIRSFYPNQFDTPCIVSADTCGKNEMFELYKNHFYFMGQLISSEDCLDYSDYCGYQDLSSSCSTVYFAPKKSLVNAMGDRGNGKSRPWMHKLFDMKIGSRVYCLSCGELELEEGHSMLCPRCRSKYDLWEDKFKRCTWCGHRLYPEDKERKDDDGMVYCQSCYNRLIKSRKENLYG